MHTFDLIDNRRSFEEKQLSFEEAIWVIRSDSENVETDMVNVEETIDYADSIGTAAETVGEVGRELAELQERYDGFISELVQNHPEITDQLIEDLQNAISRQ